MANLSQNFNFIQESAFSDEDYQVWKEVFNKQSKNLQNKACPVFLSNCKRLHLSGNCIPTLESLNKTISASTGWHVMPVDGLINNEEYFHLLSNKIFPIAMSMRSKREELISKDPDIFHEIFGHCTMLMSSDYANFMQEFAKLSLTIKEVDRPIIARLLWFTTETGLIKTKSGTKIFGSSLLSSYKESIYCLNSNEPIIKPFELVDVFREPYRADILQKVYFILNNTNQLYNLLDNTDKILSSIATARELGERPALFPITNDKYSNIGHCHSLRKNNFH
ncbi:MAG: phenylalanine 4-monooxygenase [Legionellaceae bacterium]|nr:phenylalanine 4-monooxygenase [Legionellaceae bacterium]